MTEFFDAAVAFVRRLPSERQDEIAASMLGLVEHDDVSEDIDPDHLAAIDEGLGQVERGEFASDDEVSAAFDRFGA